MPIGPTCHGLGHGLGADALLAAQLLALAPTGLGGARLCGGPGAARDAWLALLRQLLPAGAPWRRLPLHGDDERLLGGLDLAATLHAGRPVQQPGLLAQCRGGVLLVAMAERLAPGRAALLASALDDAALAAVALDEALPDESTAVPAALADRLGLVLHLEAGAPHESAPLPTTESLAAARLRLPAVACSDAMLQALVQAAEALGVPSLRACLQVLHAARGAAALAGHAEVQAEDAAAAVRLVLAPRATRLPQPAEAEAPAEAPPPAPPPTSAETSADTSADADTSAPSPPGADEPLPDQVLAAALAALPPGLLALLVQRGARGAAAGAGRAGAWQASRRRGRAYGARRGAPGGGQRLHLLATLRAAAPWQVLRRRECSGPAPVVVVHRDDFHVSRRRQRRETTTVFVVDASGSAAAHRLAEAKGAVELLLHDCYVRRDRVALVAFRGGGSAGPGPGAQLLLPPTRSLVRAKRSLAGLPGGGGTPLAAGLQAALQVATDEARRGATPVVVVLSDGRANIARDGSPGREAAARDALAAAQAWRGLPVGVLWLDTAPQPQPQARELAQAMGARYLPLPHADARQVSQVVRAASA